MFGQGLLKGLGLTWHLFFGKAITEQYPERRPNLPPASHGSLHLDKDKCTACSLCANACPNKAILLESERDEEKKRYLTGYKIILGQCLFCGLCVESCPQGALTWKPDFELACYHYEDTIQDLLVDTAGEVNKSA